MVPPASHMCHFIWPITLYKMEWFSICKSVQYCLVGKSVALLYFLLNLFCCPFFQYTCIVYLYNLYFLVFTCSCVRFAKASSTIRNRVNGPAPARAWWTNEPVSKSMAVFSCPLSPFGPWRFSSFTLCNNITSYWIQKVHDNPYRPG